MDLASFHSKVEAAKVEVVSFYRDPQLKVSENYTQFI